MEDAFDLQITKTKYARLLMDSGNTSSIVSLPLAIISPTIALGSRIDNGRCRTDFFQEGKILGSIFP